VRSIVLVEPGLFQELSAPTPALAPGCALVQVKRVGVCGSDFHAFAGSQPVYTYPRVLGHECSGEVMEAPSNPYGIQVGDRCAIEPYVACGKCKPCSLGRTNCCESLRVLGIHVDGGMTGVFSVPLHLLHKSEILSFDQLALVEMLGIGAHAVARSGLAAGEKAVVVGAGPIGLAVVQFALAAGAEVSVLEKSEPRRDFVRQFTDKVFAGADGLLGDVVFDATGSAAAMSASFSLVAPAGRLIFVGLTRQPVALDDALFHVREMTVLASRNSARQFPRIIDMIERGSIDTAPWINHRLQLRDVPATFHELTKKKDLVKAMIEVSAEDL